LTLSGYNDVDLFGCCYADVWMFFDGNVQGSNVLEALQKILLNMNKCIKKVHDAFVAACNWKDIVVIGE